MTNTAEFTRDDIISFISDTYKEAHGYRPRHLGMSSMSIEQLDRLAKQVTAEAQDAAVSEKVATEAAELEFEMLVDKTISLGAGDRETALRWISADHDDIGELLWSMGLNYSKKFDSYSNEIRAAIGIITHE